MRFKDLTGQKFGRLTVLEFAYRKGKHYHWLCKCDCGNTVIIRKDSLTKKNFTQSCGCLAIEKSKQRFTQHGLYGTRLFYIYNNMKQRCSNPNDEMYIHYGSRGITICQEWNNFKSFSNWAMNNGYQDNLTIDRIDVNGNYEPSNCRWVTNKEQQRNKRNNRIITYKNETLCLTDWATKLGTTFKKLAWRLDHNWSIERAFNTP